MYVHLCYSNKYDVQTIEKSFGMFYAIVNFSFFVLHSTDEKFIAALILIHNFTENAVINELLLNNNDNTNNKV